MLREPLKGDPSATLGMTLLLNGVKRGLGESLGKEGRFFKKYVDRNVILIHYQ
ncbi:hypothetical protein [Fodinibius halophilus]|uniref:Uncharacterized protein n=1 Tax=Fodinibius halophilus TaxID=1736908 RepID=A0A6M1T299_9BACT|nr:hypothetical protein [Fodinibius halophilus]NGP88137.1 hypothetical protein [Fodinibius halophilus]